MKRNLYISLLCGMVLANSACDKYDDTFPDKYQKIIALKQTGEQDVTLYKTGENTEFSITIMKTGYAPSLTAEATLDVLSTAALKEYDDTYTALPSTTYIIERGNVNFQAEERYKIAKVIFKTDEIQTLMEQNTDKKYILPLSLVSSTDSVNSECKLYIMKPNIVIPKVKFMPDATTELTKGFTSKTEPLKFSIPLGMDVNNAWDFKAVAQVVNNTSSGYLDPTKVALEDDGVVTFIPGKNPELKITVDAPGDQLEGFLLGGKIDIKITRLEETQFDFDATALTINVTGKKYPTNLLTPNGNYSPVDNTTFGMLLDENPATFMQTPYPNNSNLSQTGGKAPYIQLDLAQPITDFVLYMVQRNSTSLLKAFDLSTSTDGTNFTTIKSYTISELRAAGFIGASAKFTSTVFSSLTPIKHIRITQTINLDETTSMTGRWQFSLADISIYADSE